MFNLNDIFQQAQGGDAINNLARQFGISNEQAQSAVEALLPSLSAGLQARTQEPGGLADLFGAMFNQQNRQAFDNADVMQSAQTAADGEEALNQVFGNSAATQQLAAYAARSSGLSASIMQAMIPVVVSMLMGGLFKGFQNQGLGGLLEKLGQAGANAPGNSSGGLGDLLGQILGGGGAARAPQPQPQHPPSEDPQPQTGGGGLGDLLGGMLGGMLGGGARQPTAPGDQQRADQIFPQGLDPSSLQQGMDVLGKMLNPGAGSQGGAQQPGLQDLLGQLFGGGRR